MASSSVTDMRTQTRSGAAGAQPRNGAAGARPRSEMTMPAPADREKALEAALAQIDRQFGKGSVMRLGENPRPPIEVIPTGSIALDIALGIGGLPRGRVVEIYGPESSGKTTVALHAVANAQKAGGIAAFIDAEHALDPEYAKKLGVDTDALLVSQPDTGEQALEIMDMLIRSGAIDIVVIDSVAALVPKAEIEGEMGDSHVGLQARLMSQALRKITGALSNTNTTAIFINQLREKIGVMFGSPETTTGGRALKFYSSVRLDVRRIETLKDGTDAVGSRTRVKVVKNKVGSAVQAGRVRHPLRHRHLPRGWLDRHGRRAGHRAQVRCLVHLRGRPARPGQGERAGLPARQPRPRRRDREAHQGEVGHRGHPRRPGGRPRGCRGQGRLLRGRSVARSLRRARTGDGHDQPVPGTSANLTPDADPAAVARAIVLRQLTMAPRTRAQLSAAMAKRDVPDEVAEAVLDRFEEVNLVDDEEFARQWVSSRHLGRGLARRALAYELRHRGVDDVTVQAAVDQIDDDSELAAARDLVRRRLPSIGGDDPARRARRIAGMLARKGYSSGTAMRALREVLDEVPDDALGEVDDD